MTNKSKGKWNDPEYRRQYNKKWWAKKKLKPAVESGAISPATAGLMLSPWKQRQLEKRAREEASKAHPLGLEACPFCGAAFFRKIEDKYEPIKMDHCDPCEKRFYYYNGAKQ